MNLIQAQVVIHLYSSREGLRVIFALRFSLATQ